MDVSGACFDFIVVVAIYVFKNCPPESPLRQALRPFLKLVLDLILSQQVNSDVLQTASGSLYILICCFQVTKKKKKKKKKNNKLSSI